MKKSKKWYIGKSPEERRWKALRIVYDELLPDKQTGIRAIDLKKLAKDKGITASTLTKRLKELESSGWVKRIVESRTTPPSVFYVKEPFPTIVFFERSEEDNSIKIVDSFKPSSMIELPYSLLKRKKRKEQVYHTDFEVYTEVQKEEEGLPYRSSDITINKESREGFRLISITLGNKIRSELGLAENEPLILYHISLRDKFPRFS